MAGPTDPTQFIQDAKDKVEELVSSIEGLFSADKIVKTFTDLGKQIDQNRTNLSSMKSNLDEIVDVSAKILSITTKFGGFDELGKGINTVNSEFKELEARFGSIGNVLKSLGDKAPAFAKSLAGMASGAAKGFLESAETGAKLEAGNIRLAASTGQLYKLFNQAGESLENIDDVTADYADTLLLTEKATGLNAKQVTDYVNALGKIPDVLQKQIDVTGLAQDSTSALVVATKLASAAGIGAADAAKILETAYDNLSESQDKVVDSTEKGIHLFSMMIETSNKLGLRFDDTKGFLSKVADEFKLIGDNTDGATQVLGRFTNALRETGLSSKQTVDLIGGMVKSVADLGVGTKALLSIRGGGPGGLQGAFRVDRLIREGKTDEVIQMMLKSVRQQLGGGRLVTRDESDRSPQAAAQFFRQQQMLRSPAFGGLVKDDASAGRLIDALAKGNTALAKDLIKPGEATKDAVSKGTEIQNLQLNELTRLNQGMDELVTSAALANNRELRRAGGVGSAEGRARIENSRKQADVDVGQKLAGTSPGKPLVAQQTSILGIQRRGAATLTSGTRGVASGISTVVGDTVSGLKEKFKTATDKADKPGDLKPSFVEKNTAETARAVARGKEGQTQLPKFEIPVNQFGSSVQIFDKSVKSLSQSLNRNQPIVEPTTDKSEKQQDTQANANGPITINLKFEGLPDGVTVSSSSESIQQSNTAASNGGSLTINAPRR